MVSSAIETNTEVVPLNRAIIVGNLLSVKRVLSLVLRDVWNDWLAGVTTRAWNQNGIGVDC